MLKDHLSEFEISKKLSDRKFFVVSLYQWLLSGDTAVLNPWSISTNVDRVDEVKLPCKMTNKRKDTQRYVASKGDQISTMAFHRMQHNLFDRD